MAATSSGGTKECKNNIAIISKLELEGELRKLQQTYETLSQEKSEHLKRIKDLEQKLKSSQEKNKKFLEKNMELTGLNRNLKDEMQNIFKDNKKQKEQCEYSKKRINQLTQQLNQEKMEKGSMEVQLQELEALKKQLSEQSKTLSALKQTCEDKDRRIELIQHRKKKKRLLRLQEKPQRTSGVKETYFGFDEDENSVDSETSFSSLSHGTLSDDELCDELSREEVERNYQKLMKEHLELKKLHAILQTKAGSHLDPQRELKLRQQLEQDLFISQCKIERLEEDCRKEKKKLNEHIKELEKKNKQQAEELVETQELLENLEFQIIELESQQVTGVPNDLRTLETIQEDPLEMMEAREGTHTLPSSDEDCDDGRNKLKEAELHIHSLEQTASELQNKISSLQQDKAKLEDELKRYRLESQEDSELIEVLEVKKPSDSKPCEDISDMNSHVMNNANDGENEDDDERSSQYVSMDTGSLEELDSDDSRCDVNDDLNAQNGESINPDVNMSQSPSPRCDKDHSPSPRSNDRIHSPSPRSDRLHSPSPRPDGIRGDVFDLNSHMATVLMEMVKLNEENTSLKKQLQENNLVHEKYQNENNVAMETKMAEMHLICESLQEKIHCYEMTDRQLKEKLKLAEHTINDLESSEGLLRDKLEDLQKSKVELRRSLSGAEQKIHDLKEINLDKDTVEEAIREKVQALEKADSDALQRIAELEARNQMLQQRLDLRDELEDDAELIENLQERVIEVQTENLELQAKINELEENERILTNNWLKVADADANRLECLEQKVKMLESLNQDLKCKIQEQQENNVLPNHSGLSLAMELSESEKSHDTHTDQSDHLLEQITKLEDEKAVAIENIEKLQEKVAILKENEIKLSETIAEMENEEDVLRSKLRLYESKGSSDSLLLYENKVRGLQSSQENLLERLDSMEEHEQSLKERLRDVEKTYGKKLYTLENEIAEYAKTEEEMTAVLQEQEKHESELMEKVYFLEEEKLKLETENSELNEKVEISQQKESALEIELEKTGNRLSEFEKLMKEKESEIEALIRTKEKLSLELEQIQAENGDLNEKLMEIQDNDKTNVELKNQIDILQTENDSLNDKLSSFKSDFEKQEVETRNLQEVLSELIENKEKLEEQDIYVKELEKEKVYLSENFDRVKTELERSHVEFKDLKMKITDIENSETRICEMEKQIKELEEQKTNLLENVDKLNRNLEQIQLENHDLNERLIELDSSEQKNLEKLEEKSSEYELVKQKCADLEETENKLMERISELEESEKSLQEEKSERELVDNSCNTDDVRIVDDFIERCDQFTETVDLLEGQGHLEQCEPIKEVINIESVEETLKKSESVQNNFEPCECFDKSTDTSDLSDSQVKVTGLFGRVQELETENSQLSEKLSSLEFSESHVKDLSAKVKLLEESEDSLMERVMELEEKEDRLKRELSKARSSVDYVPELEDEIAELQESIKICSDEKENLEGEMKDQLRKSQELEITVHSLQQQSENSVKNLEKEKQKVESLLKGEEKLLKSLSSEKSKNEDLLSELSSLQEQIEELKAEYKQKCVKYEEREKELKDEVNQLVHEKELLLEKLNNIVTPQAEQGSESDLSENLLKSVHSVPSYGAPEIIESKCEPAFSAEINGSMDQSKSVPFDSAEMNELKSKCTNLEENIKLLEEKDYKQNLLIDELENRCLEFEDNLKIHSSTDKYQKSKIQDLENLVQHFKKRLSKSKDVKTVMASSVSDDSMDQMLMDNMKVLEKDDKTSQIRLIEHQLDTLQEVVQDLVKDFVITFGVESVAMETKTFPWIQKLHSYADDTFRQSLVDLSHCKMSIEKKLSTLEEEKRQRLTDIRTKDDKIFDLQNRVISLQSSESELQEKVKSLEASEKLLHQKVEESHSNNELFKNKHSSNLLLASQIGSSSSDDRKLVENLQEKVEDLEKSERNLKRKVEYLESLNKPTASSMLEEPEDILRQRIIELEKLEKHLKHQISDLEQDRQDLHDIARKDKSLIHDQNVKIRELQLSEKVLKEQANQYEVSEQELYNKIRELEDQIEKKEDRIRELQVLEMRLKELVQKYKLDEEVWLSKSENLVSSVTELSVSEANLKKTLEGIEREKDGLSEKSLYLEQRLKEVENAEANLVQRVKDQENKEISLNAKLQELHTFGANAELQLSELQGVNLDLTQRFNHVVQENAAMSHHIVQLQNQVEVLNQQLVTLGDSELRLKQEIERVQNSEKSFQNQLKDKQLGDVDAQGKLRQLEETEVILKDKINNLQRSENRLKYRVQELESSGSQIPGELSKSQKEKLPRKLEDCQKRIIVLQKQNEELATSLKDYQNLSASKSVVQMPQSEYRKLQAKLAVLEQTENQMDEVERLNVHLKDTVSQLREGKNVCGHEVEMDVLQKRLDQSNASVSTLKQLVGKASWEDMGPVIYRDLPVNQKPVSQINRETPGRLAERQMNGITAQFSQPIHELADNLVRNDRRTKKILGTQSDASTVEEETIEKAVQGKSHMIPNGRTTTDERRKLINDLVSHLDSSDSETANEEEHWKTVESLKQSPARTENDRWISVGKATSLHSGKNKMSRLNDEELVLGLTLPSETESQIYMQNDTDSNMSSPLMKRRKFRPSESTDSQGPPPPLPHSMPPSLQSRTTDSFVTSYNAPSSVPDSGDEVHNYYAEEYNKTQRPVRSSGYGAVSVESGLDSGRGTASVSSAPKGPSLHERIAHISQTLQSKPSSRSDDMSEDEDSAFNWRTKASEANRLLDNANKENKTLKDEINKLEKDLEDKCRYILILEAFIEKLHQLLKAQDTKSDKEIMQTIEAEMEKLKVEITDSGNKKLDISQDPVALTTQLNKKDRELSAKRNEVDSLMKELRQWQEECRTIEDMRANALDSMKCLEMEIFELQDAEKLLKDSKEAYNRLKSKHKTLQEAFKELVVIESERFDLEQEVKFLQEKVKVIPELESEYSVLEDKLEETSKLLDDRGEKVNDLLNEITELNRKVVSLEQENLNLEKDVEGYGDLKSRYEESEQARNSALVTVAPLKAKIKRLCQKCREKDDLLHRLGVELKKLNGTGKPIRLLEELNRLEALMANEEYNSQDGEMVSQGNVSPRLQPSGGDLGRSSSASSFSDSQTSDSEVRRPCLSDQYDRHQRPLQTNQHKEHLPHIYRPDTSPSYRGDNFVKIANKDRLQRSPQNQRSTSQDNQLSPPSPSYMPPNPMFVAVTDYNPQLFSRSGRQRLELSLTEGDQVRVTGPLDQNGYFEAEVNGKVGLVPANYLQQLPEPVDVNGHLSPQERRLRQLQQSPGHLDSSPEKILNMRNQLQQSPQPNIKNKDSTHASQSVPQINGHVSDRLSPRSPRGHQTSRQQHHQQRQLPKNQAAPDPPRDFHVVKQTGDHSVLVTWVTPYINELGRNNGLQVTGYKFFINGKPQQQVNSPHVTKTIVDNINLSREVRIGIQTLTSVGRSSVVMETVYKGANDISDAESDLDSDMERILNSQQYKTGQKKVFLGVYDYDPMQQSPREYKNCELSFEAGDVITVYGRERPDGFFYSEINGRRGLVPASFIEEVPMKLPMNKQGSANQISGGVSKGQRKVKQTQAR